MSVLVLGDLLVDVVVHPLAPVPRDALSLDHIRAQVAFSVGGSGFHLSTAVAELVTSPVYLVTGVSSGHVLGEVAKAAIGRASAGGVNLIINTVAEATGGATVIAYLDGGHERMMFADPGACDVPWDAKVRAEVEAQLRSCQLVVVSGHVLFRDGSTRDARWVMGEARKLGIPVALDLVPHSVHRRVPREELFHLLSNVSYLSGNVNTFLAFTGHPRLPEAGREEILESIGKFLTLVDIVAAHFPDLSRWVVDHQGLVEHQPVPAMPEAKVGLTDRAIANDLVQRYLPQSRKQSA